MQRPFIRQAPFCEGLFCLEGQLSPQSTDVQPALADNGKRGAWVRFNNFV